MLMIVLLIKTKTIKEEEIINSMTKNIMKSKIFLSPGWVLQHQKIRK